MRISFLFLLKKAVKCSKNIRGEFMISTRLEYKIEDTKDSFKILRINKDNKWIYIGI